MEASTATVTPSRSRRILRLVLLNPNGSEAASAAMGALAEREVRRITSSSAAPCDVVEVAVRTNTDAPPLLKSPSDMRAAVSGVVRIGLQEADLDHGADSVIVLVAAFSDPGVPELREALLSREAGGREGGKVGMDETNHRTAAASCSVKVLGIGEEAYRKASSQDRMFGVATITPDAALVASFRARAGLLGLEAQFTGTRVAESLGVDPVALLDDDAALDAALRSAIEACVNEDGAQAVIIGGGPLSDAAERLQGKVAVPLIVAVTAAVQAALQFGSDEITPVDDQVLGKALPSKKL